MQQKFNEAFVKAVRNGEAIIIHDSGVGLLNVVLNKVFEGIDYYKSIEDGKEYYSTAATLRGCPIISVSDFFLRAQPLRIEDVTKDQIILCTTEEENELISQLLDKSGRKLHYGAPYANRSTKAANTYFDIHEGCIDVYNVDDKEAIPASLFLQPPTEKEGKERTYRVTREQIKNFYETASIEEGQAVNWFMHSYFGMYESEITYTDNELKVAASNVAYGFIVKLLFPDYSPVPHIPKGEFAWVRDKDNEEWKCRMSAGDGKFYPGQQEWVFSNPWKQVRKYEDRPF